MELNKITSDLTYLGNTIKEIKVNNHFVSLGDDVTKEIGFDYGVSNIETYDDGRMGRIQMSISVFLSSEKVEKDEFSLLLEGAFSVPQSVTEDDFIRLLSLNGAAALYSIGRGKIETISALTFLNGKLNLPMVNIQEFQKMKAKEGSGPKDEA
jgi:hypothetical protein